MPVGIPVFDADIWEVHLIVEVRQVVLPRPLLDLVRISIRMAVVVVALAVAGMQPLLVLTLELVIQHDAVNGCATALQRRRFALERTIDLEVVFELALSFDALPEGLTAILVSVSMTFENAPAGRRQADREFSRAGHAYGFDQALLAQVPQIAGAGIERPIPAVPKVTTRDHSKGAERRQRARLGAAQCVFAVAVAHQLAINAARQVQLTREGVACIVVARPLVAVTFRRASILATAIVIKGLARIAAATSKRRPVIAAITRLRDWMFIAGIRIARIEIHGNSFDVRCDQRDEGTLLNRDVKCRCWSRAEKIRGAVTPQIFRSAVWDRFGTIRRRIGWLGVAPHFQKPQYKRPKSPRTVLGFLAWSGC